MSSVTQAEARNFLVRLRQLAGTAGDAMLIGANEQELIAVIQRLLAENGGAVEMAPKGIIRLYGTPSQLQYCSETVLSLFAVSECERDQLSVELLLSRVWPTDRPRFQALLNPVASVEAEEIRLLLPDHQSYYLSCQVVRLADGEAATWELQIRNITELRRNTMFMDIQHEIAIAVNSSFSLEELAVKMLNVGMRIDGIDRGLIFYRDRHDPKKYIISAHLGCHPAGLDFYGHNGCINEDFFQTMGGLRDIPKYLDHDWTEKMMNCGYPNYGKLQSIAFIPIMLNGQLEAVLCLASGIFMEIPLFVRNIIELIGADIGAVVARVMAEQALKQSEENYRLLVENQSDLILKVGLDGRILFVSKACCEFFKKTPAELCGRRLTALFHWRDLLRIIRQADCLKNPPYQMAIEQCLGKGENERWLSWRCNAIVEHGKVLAYLGIGRDITANKKSENLLLQSERRLRLILRAVSDCTWDWNLTGDELTMDHKLYEILGYSPDEIKITIFDIIRNFVHIEDRRRVEHDIRELVDGIAETFDCSFRMRRRDGTYFWVLMRAVVVKGLDDEPVRIVGCIEDITDRRDYDRMKENYTFLQKMLDALPLPVFFKDVNGKYLGFNKAMSRGFDVFRGDTAIGRHAADIWNEFHPGIAEKIEFEEKKLLKEGGHSSYVLQVTGDEGCTRELVIHKSLVFSSNGSPECMVGAIIDVTDLKKTEYALKVASQRLNTILNVMHEIIIWFDTDMRVIWANRAAYETLGGIAGRDITGMRCRDIWFSRCAKENAATCDDFSIGKGGGKEVFRLDDGRFFETWFYPVTSNADDTGWIQLALDVSEQERARDEARTKQEQLIQADKMTSLGILVSGVAHEINNPNNFIVINVSILKKAWENILKLLDEYAGEKGEFNVAGVPYSKFSSMVTDLLAGIDEGAERIRVIVNDLKDYVRQTPTDLKGSFNVNDALSRAFTLCRNMIKRATNNYKIVYGNELPLVKGDVYRIEQVIINIVQNACHALKSRESAITVSTSCCDGREVMIEVVDEGIGIAPDNLKHITDPFFTTKRDIGGTGLGLAISSSIIEEHNGRLQIESSIGEGTTVRVYLPVAIEVGGTTSNEPPVSTTALNTK